MTAVAIKGWCPSAHRPMQSGDGLVARIRPRQGRLSAAQAVAIAELAERYGNGLIDLTGRANLQVRGLRAEGHQALLASLAELGLIDADAGIEAQRNILVAPFLREGDDTQTLAAELERALGEQSLGLPEKFGFAVDCGEVRLLAQASADIRIERSADGGLMVRANGAEHCRVVTRTNAVDLALSLAKWFLASGGASGGRGRMAAHIGRGAKLPDALAGDAMPARALPTPAPSVYASGALVGIAFGQLRSATLKFLGECEANLRLTPWRMILLEGLREMPVHEGIVASAGDPLLHIAACTGAPRCQAAHAETRALAAALAPHLPAQAKLHVSGCAKGCAHPGAADVTLVATSDGFDLVRRGTTRDAPSLRGVSRADILADPRAVLEAL
jgi:precorrin-3B synthase